MSSDEPQSNHSPDPKPSRRSFLKTAAALAMTSSAIACGQKGEVKETQQAQEATPSGKPRLLYIGTYSSPTNPADSPCNGKGIYLFEMDTATGKLTQREVFPNDNNPSWLDLSPSKTHLYCVDEIHKYKGSTSDFGKHTSFCTENKSLNLFY